MFGVMEFLVATVGLLMALAPTLVVVALLVAMHRRVRTLEERVAQLEAEPTAAGLPAPAPPATPTA